MYEMARWVYDSPSELHYLDHEGQHHSLLSLQGVRQGDPLGPLFFSLASRPRIARLQERLAGRALITFYLDDGQVLSESPILDEVKRIWDEYADGAVLNAAKCSEHVMGHGEIYILGHYVGNDEAGYLADKVDEAVELLHKLDCLPAQHAIRLGRLSTQHTHRHLMRTLSGGDQQLAHWRRLDDEWLQFLVKKQGEGVEQTAWAPTLASLPLRMGGMGFLAHADCAVPARQASSEVSDAFIARLTGGGSGCNDGFVSQRERCSKIWQQKRDAMLSAMNDEQVTRVAENSGKLASMWLCAAPGAQGCAMSNRDVAVALRHRMVAKTRAHDCWSCGVKNIGLSHGESCRRIRSYRTPRHEDVKTVMASYLSTIDGSNVRVEVHLENSSSRPSQRKATDIQITGAASYGGISSEYDISITSLFAATHARTLGRRGTGNALLAQATSSISNVLKTKDAEKHRTYDQYMTVPFYPLSFSSGGAYSPVCEPVFAHWKAQLGQTRWDEMLREISVCLAKYRARTYRFFTVDAA